MVCKEVILSSHVIEKKDENSIFKLKCSCVICGLINWSLMDSRIFSVESWVGCLSSIKYRYFAFVKVTVAELLKSSRTLKMCDMLMDSLSLSLVFNIIIM